MNRNPNNNRLLKLNWCLAAFAFCLILLPQAEAQTFSLTGLMNYARVSHTATLLTNGMVLVAGGSGPSGILSSAELYNPTTGTWTNTGSMNVARDVHTATLLTNGMVLVAGGETTNNTILSSAELYDPVTGTWTTTGLLNTARENHTATLLTNGMVLVAGGNNNGGQFSSAELYNPATGIWINTGSLNTARELHTANLLTNGMVLVAGGRNSSSAADLSSTELFNPTTGTWTTTGSMRAGREEHTAVLLTNGMVLVAGGLTNFLKQSYLFSAELYDPATGTWTITGSLNTARVWHTATLLTNGMVLVAGGWTQASGQFSSAELFNPTTGTWTNTRSMNNARSSHTSTLLTNGMVLVAGGYGNGFLSSAELFDSTPQPPPTIGITTYSNTPVVFFPTASGTNYTLQMCTNLSSPVWVAVTNGIPFSGVQIINPPSNAFFRLN